MRVSLRLGNFAKRLQQIAKAERETISGVIRTILGDYLGEESDVPKAGNPNFKTKRTKNDVCDTL